MVSRNSQATPATNRLPSVQKYSICNKYFPLSRLGRNSSKRSNGTVNPPTPTPTTNRQTNNVSSDEDPPLNRLKKATRKQESRNAFFLPNLSAIGPHTRPPINWPQNTTERIEALATGFNDHSFPADAWMNAKTETSIESVANKSPVKSSSFEWKECEYGMDSIISSIAPPISV